MKCKMEPETKFSINYDDQCSTDWYKTRGAFFKRSQLLAIIFVIKDILPKTLVSLKHISRTDFLEQKQEINIKKPFISESLG